MHRAVAAGLFFWAGLLAGVSFVATQAKFLAPSLPLAQALDVGRWTFHVLALVEAALALLAFALFVAARRTMASAGRIVLACLVAVAAILAVESFALRPMLDARVLEIMAGRTVAPSGLHDLYVGLELAKLGLLLVAAVAAGRSRTE